MPNVDIETEVLERFQQPFHIISFPSLERENILLHCLLGHEIGHLFAEKFLTKEREAKFKSTVVPSINRLVKDELQRTGLSAATPLFIPLIRQQLTANQLNLATSYWIRALEEIISDIVGVLLFGPAAVFSTLEMAMQEGYDIPPSPENNFYPPWRMRLRNVLKVIDSEGGFFPIPHQIFPSKDGIERTEQVNARYELIREIVSAQDERLGIHKDIYEINKTPIAMIAYQQVDAAIEESLLFLLNETKIRRHKVRRNRLYSDISILIDRLDHNIPPNAFEKAVGEEERLDIVHIINASWFHRVSISMPSLDTEDGNSSFEEGLQRQRQLSNRLTVKAIELASLSRSFKTYFKNSESRGRAKQKTNGRHIRDQHHNGQEHESKNELTGGVLTKDEILWKMESPSVAERLIITPLLDPEASLGNASVDVRLGNVFIVMKREAFPLLDIDSIGDLESGIGRYQENVIKGFGERFIIHPGQLVLGSTLEYIQLPCGSRSKDSSRPGLMCNVIGKSTWGRMGLVIATAIKVDPGFRGCITLELINEGEVPLILYPGMPIAQLVLHRTAGTQGYDGTYLCPTGPEFPKFGGLRKEWSYWTSLRKSPRTT